MHQLHVLLGRSCISSTTRYGQLCRIHCPNLPQLSRVGFPLSSRSSTLGRHYASATVPAPFETLQNAQDSKEDEQPKRWRIVHEKNHGRADNVSKLTSDWTFDDLERESNIDNHDLRAIRLVDQVRYCNNIELWLVLLRYKQRIQGDRGTLDIWRGMRERQVRIPLEGPEAVELWDTVVKAAWRERHLDFVIGYAQDVYNNSGMAYPRLYDLIVGHILATAKNKKIVWYWHTELKRMGLPLEGTFARIAEQGTSSVAALGWFERLYLDSKDNKLYDSIITRLCDQGKFQEATHWHDIMIPRFDCPSDAAVTGLLMQNLKEAAIPKTSGDTYRTTESGRTGPVYGQQQTQNNITLSRPFMNKVLGEKHGIKAKFISDQTCAKAFATSAFSVDFVMRSLSAFGVGSLGPLALRQIGLRSSDTREFMKHVKAVNGLNIKVDDCVYSQLLLRLAVNETEPLFDALLATDQHPEVFEDKTLQLELLKQHILRQDWTQLHVAIITLIHGHREPASEAYNVLLRARIETGDVGLVHALIDEMMDTGIGVRTASIRHAFFQWVSIRRPGQRAATQGSNTEGLNSLIIMVLHIMRRNGNVSPSVWRQPLIYLGMEGRLEDLEALIVWLSQYYCKDMAIGKSFEKSRLYEELFPTLLQKAFISWGFVASVRGTPKAQLVQHLPPLRSASLLPKNGIVQRVGQNTNKLLGEVVLGKFYRPDAPWTRGIALLRVLKQCGVKVDIHAVRSACRHSLRQLYGNQISRRRINRVVKQKNKQTFLQTLRHANLAWTAAEPLFPQVWRLKKLTVPQQKLYLEQVREALTKPKQRTTTTTQLRRQYGTRSTKDNSETTAKPE